MSCLYCWNQPKKYGRYDLILDGKISAKDITITNGTGTDFVSLVDKLNIIDSEMGFMHSYDDTYKSYNELLEAFHQRKLKEHVVYLVPNENTSSHYKTRIEQKIEYVKVPKVDENGLFVTENKALKDIENQDEIYNSAGKVNFAPAKDENGNDIYDSDGNQLYIVPVYETKEKITDVYEEEDRAEEDKKISDEGPYTTEDKYDEYMIIKGQLELIGSGSYQRIRQDIEAITGYDILHNWDGENINQNDD
jgi:hypothetical protein